MPIFEFHCPACKYTFELITKVDSPAECPKCGSTATQKLLSAFAVGSVDSSGHSNFHSSYEQPTACGRCGDPRGPGPCSWDDE